MCMQQLSKRCFATPSLAGRGSRLVWTAVALAAHGQLGQYEYQARLGKIRERQAAKESRECSHCACIAAAGQEQRIEVGLTLK